MFYTINTSQIDDLSLKSKISDSSIEINFRWLIDLYDWNEIKADNLSIAKKPQYSAFSFVMNET